MSVFFTVVIPQYNSEKYIEETLRSLLVQTYSNFEILVVDDHSTDQGLEIATTFIYNHGLKGRVILRDAAVYPKGVSGCRNMGIDYAKGDWICFLDSDDLFSPEKIQKVYEAISESATCSAFFSGLQVFEDITLSDKEKIVRSDMSGMVDILPILVTNNIICTSTVAVKKSLIKELGNFLYELNGIEDYYCWLKISKKVQWYYHPEVLVRYRVRSGSLMRRRHLSHYVEQTLLMIKLLQKEPILNHEEYNKTKHYLLSNLGTFYANYSIKDYGLWITLTALSGTLKMNFYAFFTTTALRLIKFRLLNKYKSYLKIIRYK